MNKLEAVIKSVSQSAGPRPHFFQDPDVDRVLDITMALAAELAAVYERVDTLERVLEKRGGLDRADLEAYQPDGEVSTARLQWDEAFVRRLLRVLSAELSELKDGAAVPSAIQGE
jgi:hypothetical protein